ncbi:MAG TPA: hypothetical protein PKL57_06015, partial [Candidatus Wallbacteria bacterium]|nr:hypothetical protein [Candidatus Wallbacteria bacterium]
TGVVAGSVNSKEAAVSWQEEPGVSYYARLTKNGGNPIEFVNGSKISNDGSYDIEVTARKESNGLTNRAAISFKVDTSLPAVPVIEGISPDGVSASTLSLSWKEIAGVYYSASIKKNDDVITSYGNGFPITENGRYVLEVTATKLSNGLKSKTALNFTIDKNPPEEPVILGVETGSTTPKPVSIEWKTQEGVKTAALIYRDGRSPRAFASGTTLLEDGSYKIEVTAYKVSNGLSSKSSKSFIINKSIPETPRVSGVENLKIYNSPVKPLWEEPSGVSVRAKLSKDGASAVDFIKGSIVAENGRYMLSVTAYGANDLSNETVLSFVVDRSAPEAPAISIVSKDAATMATWIENQGFSYSAKISKTGGIAEEYKNGNSITEDGFYTLELTVVKVSNGLSVKSSVNFTRTGVKIEKGPAAPQVSGVENGKYYNAAVTPFWKEIDGAKISAILTKFGNQPSAIVNSTKITDDGSYILEVTAANSSNNMSSKTTAAFIIDTTRPSAVLKYSANPAAEGVMRITAFYSETLAKGSVPKISINQPGSADITGAAMTQDSSNPASWYYDYTVKAADGSAYIDGVATVKLSDVSDPAGNVSQAAQNDSFVINTSAPAAAINYSFTPAVSQNMSKGAPDRSPAASKANVFRAGKLTVIVSFANDIKTGQTPKIFIDQPGYGDVKDQPMAIGSSRRVWTYEYSIKPEDGQAYIDGQASVSISNAMDESGRLFLQPANRTFTIDTRMPSVELSYSSNPAPAGKLTITAKYSELLQEGCAPYISIFQQGSYELVDAVMTRGASSDVWTYEYTVKSSDLKEFKDGKAMVLLSPVTDAAGNISKRPYNSTFLIGTAVANYAVLTFGSNPARAGKMTVTAVFKDDYSGAGGPRISIEQPGKADVMQKWMTQGASRKIWTYDYVINDNNGVDFIDGTAIVSLLDDMGGKIEITGGNTFSIDTTPPAVALLSLNDGAEKLIGGSTYTLKWSASDSGGLDPAPVTIAFYNGLNWTTVETGLANSGTYDWKVPSVDLSTAKVSVSAVDKVGNRSTSPSRNPFTIISSGPSWSLGYPKAEASSSSSFKVTAKSDRGGKLYYMVFPGSAGIASLPAANVKAGNFDGAVKTASGAVDITASTELSFEVKELNVSSAYDIFLIIEDSNMIMQKEPQKISVTTLSKGIAFSSGYPAASQSGESYSMKINIRVKTGEAGKVYISGFNLYSFEPVPAPPTSTEVKDGRWSYYRARPSVMKIDMTAGTEMTQSIDMMMVDPMMMMYMDMPGMEPQSNYILYAVAEDANGNLMDKPVKINWKSPILKISIPNDSNSLTKNSMSVKISSDSSGRAYYIVSKNSSAPSLEQLKNGADASGGSVANGFKGELDLEANSEKTIAVSGLSESTQYYFFAAIESDNNMVSSVASSNQITRGLEPIMLPGHPYSIVNWNAQSRWGVSLNSPGTVYAVAVPRGSKVPSAEQIKNGLNAEGKAAPDKGAIKPPEFSTDYWAADQHILFTKLTRWAEYDMYYVMADVNGKLYNVNKMEFMAR